MRFEAYPLVTGYPLEVPKLKVLSLKWAYKQDTTRGWCQLPQSISHRFEPDGRFNMLVLMQDIDAILFWMTQCAKEVMKEGADALKARTKWTAEVDVGTMNQILAVPKTKEGMTLRDQQKELAGNAMVFFCTETDRPQGACEVDFRGGGRRPCGESSRTRDDWKYTR